MRFIKILSFIFVLSFSNTALAETISGLEIESFYKKLDMLYTNEEPNVEAILEFSRAHSFEDYKSTKKTKARFSSEIEPVITETESTRDVALKDIQDEEETLHNTVLSRTITGIQYNDEQSKAEVGYTSLFKGVLKRFSKEENKLMMVKFTSFSQCSERLGIENAIVKSHGADCTTETLYSKPEPAK